MQGEINQLADVRGTQNDRESTAHESSRQTLQEQLDRMNQLVSYQLQRAVKSEAAPSLSRHVPVAKVVAGICRALEKVYRDKPVTISQHIDSALLFQGDERDLMEVMGNVLDNACKYGNGQVSISSVTVSALPDVVKNAGDLPAVMDSRSDQLLLLIEDNGDGVDHALQQQVLERGVRLDTLKQGQGIGLAVVNDIVTSYGGLLAIGQSAGLGGAAVMIGLENFRLKPSGSTS
jgi:two-component system sensor histidine kinase PhoQ